MAHGLSIENSLESVYSPSCFFVQGYNISPLGDPECIFPECQPLLVIFRGALLRNRRTLRLGKSQQLLADDTAVIPAELLRKLLYTGVKLRFCCVILGIGVAVQHTDHHNYPRKSPADLTKPAHTAAEAARQLCHGVHVHA